MPKILFPVFMFAFIFSLQLIFPLLAARISHFLTAPPLWNFHVFLPAKFVSFDLNHSLELFLCLSLFLHVSVNIKNNVEKDTTLVLFFLSKSSGGHTISPPKHLELSVVSYLLTELFYIGMPVVRTDGRAYGHVIANISRMGRLLNFLTQGALTTSNYLSSNY